MFFFLVASMFELPAREALRNIDRSQPTYCAAVSQFDPTGFFMSMDPGSGEQPQVGIWMINHSKKNETSDMSSL